MFKTTKPTLKKNVIPSFNIIKSALLSRATTQYPHQCIKNTSQSIFWFYNTFIMVLQTHQFIFCLCNTLILVMHTHCSFTSIMQYLHLGNANPLVIFGVLQYPHIVLICWVIQATCLVPSQGNTWELHLSFLDVGIAKQVIDGVQGIKRATQAYHFALFTS